MKVVSVNTVKNNASGFDAVAGIAAATRDLRLDSIELDFSSCSFFEANMAAPLYTVIARLRNDLNDVSIVNMSSEIRKVLRKNKFLKMFNQPNLTDIDQMTWPFKVFKLSAGDQFGDYLDAHMKGRGIPVVSEALSKRFRQSLFEIFLNATLHSQSESGIFVCGQFYPQKQRMDFTISDAGVGIRENVRRYTGKKKISSCNAILWAMAEGNTTKTGNQPGGLGLKLIKDFIKINLGKMHVVSRFGYYEFSANGESLHKINNDFPGTCIHVEINTKDTNRYCLRSELKSEDIF